MKLLRHFVLLASIFSSLNASAEIKAFEFFVDAKLDATGAVIAADVDDKFIANEFETAIVRLMKQWRFQPREHSGQKVSVSTTIKVEISVEIAADKSAAMTARYVNHGPEEIREFRRNNPPKFPPSTIRSQRDALVVLLVQIDSDGHPKRIEPFSIHVRGGKPKHSKTYLAPAIAAVKQWRFKPESIDGIPVTGALLVPIRFGFQNQHKDWNLLVAPTAEMASLFGDAHPDLDSRLPRISNFELRMINPTNASDQR